MGLAPKQDEMKAIISSIDPTSDGFATYASFVAVCALKMHSRSEESISQEAEQAYQLFTGGGDGPITLADLRRVAGEVNEDMPDELLKDMILEANGGAGVKRGVDLQDFEIVMRSIGFFKRGVGGERKG